MAGREWWRRYSLSLVLLGLFLVSWAAQAVFEWATTVQEAQEHGTSADLGQYLASFGQSTMENWQSEFLQLLTFVVLTTILIHQGSPESRDGDDEMRATLERVEKKVDALSREDVLTSSSDERT